MSRIDTVENQSPVTVFRVLTSASNNDRFVVGDSFETMVKYCKRQLRTPFVLFLISVDTDVLGNSSTKYQNILEQQANKQFSDHLGV